MNIDSVSEYNYIQLEQKIGDPIEKISSAQNINKAADGPAALVEINRMSGLISGRMEEIKNEEISVTTNRIKDSGLSGINDNLQQIRSLMVESQNSSVDADTKELLNSQIKDIVDSTQHIVDDTKYGPEKLITPGVDLQAILKGVTTTDPIPKIDDAIKEVSGQLAETGAKVQESTSTINTAMNEVGSQLRGLSVIRDSDTAQNMMELIRAKISNLSSVKELSGIMHLDADRVSQLLG